MEFQNGRIDIVYLWNYLYVRNKKLSVFLKQSFECEQNETIKFKIARTIAELEEHDCDPYWSLK